MQILQGMTVWKLRQYLYQGQSPMDEWKEVANVPLGAKQPAGGPLYPLYKIKINHRWPASCVAIGLTAAA